LANAIFRLVFERIRMVMFGKDVKQNAIERAGLSISKGIAEG
jgi:hypothetical protein